MSSSARHRRAPWRLPLLAAAAALAAGCDQRPADKPSPASRPASAPATDTPPTIRIATFNIREFTDDAPKDFAALAKICGRYDLVAIQEVKDTGAGVEKLRERLGENWASIVSPLTQRQRFAFLYRSDRIAYLGRSGWLSAPAGQPPLRFLREPYSAHFKAGNFDFLAVTVHLNSSEDATRDEEVDQLVTWHKAHLAADPEKDVILLGDFNEENAEPLLGEFTAAGTLDAIISSVGPTRIGHDERLDHLVLNTRYTREFTGRVGAYAFDQELFGGDAVRAVAAVSDHRPVYGVFRTDLPDDD